MRKILFTTTISILTMFSFTRCSLSHKAKRNPDKIIHGYVAPGFEEVKEEYINNFIHRKENGSAITIYYKGDKVVDLWGEYRDALTNKE